MSFRTTTLLFGVLLAVLWVFGLTVALRRSSLDQGLVLPKFGQWIGRSEERDLRELLETTLAARVVDSGLPLSVRKIENKPLG